MHDDIERRLERLEAQQAKAKGSGLTFFSVLEKLLLPASIAGLGLFANAASTKIQQGQLTLAEAQEERQAQESRTALQLRYLDLVYSDLKTNDPGTQTSALGFLMGVDPEIGLTLARAVANNPATSPAVRSAATRVARAIEKYGELASYKIGIYYDRDDGALSEMAMDLVERLAQDGFEGDVEAYPRSVDQLALAGLATENQIRFEDPFERGAAERLHALLADFQADGVYALLPVATPTPRFVSIFLVVPGDIPVGSETMTSY